jgi:enoyl-CoA hydratase/carnithine racemase
LEFENIIYEKKGKIAYITTNRAEVLNALSSPAIDELVDAFLDFRDDPDLQVAIWTGVGDRSFSAGRDLKWSAAHPDHFPDLKRQKTHRDTALRIGDFVRLEIWKPIIAAVNGYCLGRGLESALACDIIVASENASFGLPEVNRGWPPGAGGPFRLPRQIPLKVAMYMLLTGDRISAQEAYRIGLVNQVVPLAELIPAATKIAERICENPPQAVQAAKELAMRSLDMPLNYPHTAWDLYSPGVTDEVRRSRDRKEGLQAFVEKRKADFRGQ